MEANFWHERWKSNRIGFHQNVVNRMLADYLHRLKLKRGARLFLPMCGKTLDIAWLLSQGFRVAGVELSDIAVSQLFEEMDVAPELTAKGPLNRYSSHGLDIYAGDIFDLTQEELGSVDAVYDRAALVALPEHMRTEYVTHVTEISGASPQLLISFEYDQAEMNGPPFSIPRNEVTRLYGNRFDVSLLADKAVSGKLKGVCEAQEQAWLLHPKLV